MVVSAPCRNMGDGGGGGIEMYGRAIPADPPRYYDTRQGHGASYGDSVREMTFKFHWELEYASRHIPARKTTNVAPYTKGRVMLTWLTPFLHQTGSAFLSRR